MPERHSNGMQQESDQAGGSNREVHVIHAELVVIGVPDQERGGHEPAYGDDPLRKSPVEERLRS